MDLFLLLDLAHAVAAIAWAAAGAVLALILLASRRDAAAARRALAETALIDRRAMRPAALATLVTGAALAAASGLAGEAWVALSAALVFLSLAARPTIVAPAVSQAEEGRGPARPALRLVAFDLAVQGAAVLLMILRPGWAEALILSGLLACLLLAAALLRSLGEGLALPS